MSLPRYREYKDSGVPWLGDVPSHWAITPLKYLVRLRSGGTPSKERAEYWDGSVPWASSKDLKVEVLGDTVDHVTMRAVEDGAAELVPAGASLVVVRGMILAHSFPVARLSRAMAINQDLKAVLPREGLREDFLAWLLRGSTSESLSRLDEAAHGTKALRMGAWASMELPLPPSEEQARIAAFLDRETAKIDALIAEQERLVALLDEKRQAVITQAVTKGLDPSVPMQDSGIEWLPSVPAHWAVVKLKHLVHTIEQGWSPQCEADAVEDGSAWAVLKVGCVNGGVFRAEENKRLPDALEPIPSLSVRSGDLLISRANTRELVGSAAVVEADHPKLMLSDKLYRLRFEAPLHTPQFLAFFLRSSAVRGRIELTASGASSSMLNIAQDAILEQQIPLPPTSERAAIVDALQLQLREQTELSSTIERAVGLLRERRAALISAAVTGQIDVRGLVDAEAA